MNTFFSPQNAERMGKVLLVGAVFVALFFGMKFLGEARKLVTSGTDITKASTIDVSGEGFAFAIPDVANVSFTIEQKAATVAAAQDVVTKKINDTIKFLEDSGIAKKDIQTTNYSANPNYTYPTPCADRLCTQVYTSPKIVGYTVSNTITVKIRDTEKVGEILDGLGSRGVTGLSGPDFTVDDPEIVKNEAREKAIEDAKEKAEVLSKQLGVRLVSIVRFSENGGGYPSPMYAKMGDMELQSGVGGAGPEMPVGQNKYTSNVTITYQIR
ncbi:MAG: SIMPL domain-containing protein [Candidatus Pacebacteria bacterium]|nr:SIMPL domain-containing protein [Candidatus Paceibacterota bacterium]